MQHGESEEYSSEDSGASSPIPVNPFPDDDPKDDGKLEDSVAEERDNVTKGGDTSIGVEAKPIDGVPNESAEPSKPAKKSRKRKNMESVDGGDSAAGKPAPKKKKSRNELAVEEFMLHQLPSLRKELKIRKKNQVNFNIRDHDAYFKPGSEFTPTFCLSLFHVLGRNEIVCSRYGKFQGGSRHMVKCDNGFKHVSLLMGHCEFAPDEAEFIMKKYGREWFKIPSKDETKVTAAQTFGDKGAFKIILTSVYEDCFIDKDGKKVMTINPVLRYEPIKAKETKSARGGGEGEE